MVSFATVSFEPTKEHLIQDGYFMNGYFMQEFYRYLLVGYFMYGILLDIYEWVLCQEFCRYLWMDILCTDILCMEFYV